MRTTFFVITILAALLLGLSMWPGFISDLSSLCCLCSAIFPCAIVAIGGICFGIAYGTLLIPRSREYREWGYRVLALITVTILLLAFDVPIRLAFACHVAAFEQLRVTVREKQMHDMTTRYCYGLYTVQELASDGNGAVYFCTGDGSGPGFVEQRYYGFAYRPSNSVTPWGGDHYRLQHLFGNWYTYTVSID